jgi:outer membrane immunogenic protein
MKKLANGVAALVVTLLGTSAWAADMATKAPTKASTAATWTGWYLGLNAGGFWGTSQTATTVTPLPLAGLTPAAIAIINAQGAPANIGTSGFIGGVHGGYNYQAGQWLVGLEADFESYRNKGSLSSSVPGIVPGATFVLNSSVSTDWLLTLRPRLGLVTNDWLLYSTGGLAVSRISGAWNWSNPGGAPALISENGSAASTKTGWTVGGGVERMLPGRWLVGVEYLYVKFSSISVTSLAVSALGGPINPFTHSADLSSNIVRLRLSKAF